MCPRELPQDVRRSRNARNLLQQLRFAGTRTPDLSYFKRRSNHSATLAVEEGVVEVVEEVVEEEVVVVEEEDNTQQ